MTYQYRYKTPSQFSDMLMRSDGKFLTGLWFEGSRDVQKHPQNAEIRDLPVFEETCRWLDCYYSGEIPDFMPEYRVENITPFRNQVIEIMKTIPYGETITYQDIAIEIARIRGIEKMSAQAVGGAVGWNPLCILVPCHRVVGTGGSLTGYGGGIQNKVELLKLEGADMTEFFVPRRGTAL